MDTSTHPEPPSLCGLDLRSAIVLLLLDHGRPMAIPRMIARLHASGFAIEGRPSKTIADALRWEVRRRRVVRVGRGTYASGAVAKSTKHRMRARVAATRNRTTALG